LFQLAQTNSSSHPLGDLSKIIFSQPVVQRNFSPLCHYPDEKPGWHEFQLHASTFARFSKQKQRSRAPARELEASS
jgi:hypothetical protein